MYVRNNLCDQLSTINQLLVIRSYFINGIKFKFWESWIIVNFYQFRYIWFYINVIACNFKLTIYFTVYWLCYFIATQYTYYDIVLEFSWVSFIYALVVVYIKWNKMDVCAHYSGAMRK